MFVVCAWCKSEVGEKEPIHDRSTTHGICAECRTKLLTPPPNAVVDVEMHDTVWGTVAIGEGLQS